MKKEKNRECQMCLTMSKELREHVKNEATAKGLPVNAFIRAVLKDAIRVNVAIEV